MPKFSLLSIKYLTILNCLEPCATSSSGDVPLAGPGLRANEERTLYLLSCGPMCTRPFIYSQHRISHNSSLSFLYHGCLSIYPLVVVVVAVRCCSRRLRAQREAHRPQLYEARYLVLDAHLTERHDCTCPVHLMGRRDRQQAPARARSHHPQPHRPPLHPQVPQGPHHRLARLQ